MSYLLSPKAEQELADAFSYYLEHGSKRVAEKFLAEFERAANLVDQNPGLGTITRNGRRIFPIRRYSYSIVYRSIDDGAKIGAVVHENRGPKYRRQTYSV